MWFLTVFGLMWRSAAIWALSLPFAISFRTWISRSESSERIVSASRCDGLVGADVPEHLRRDGRRDERLARRGGPDAREQLVDRRVLQQVAAGAGQDRLQHVAVLVGDREHEHPRQGRDHRDLPGRLDAADPRHVEVHDDDVRRDLADGVSASVPLRPRRRCRLPVPPATFAGPCGRGHGRRPGERAGDCSSVIGIVHRAKRGSGSPGRRATRQGESSGFACRR